MDKIQKSIELIQKAEKLALEYSEDGFHLAFSGGKDSQVIYHLAKMAGVKFKAYMSITTIDPPELLRFIRKNYPDVIFIRPKINFYNLIIKKKMLPTQMVRYCCGYLKEQAGAGTVVILGIRKAESTRRAKRNELEISSKKYSNSLDQFNIDREILTNCIKGKDKIMLSPILNWTDAEVWNFIKTQNLEYCSLYDNGYKRIGCVFCPMSNKKSINRDRQNYPKIEKTIKKSIKYLCDNYNYGPDLNHNVDDIFEWWISKKSMKLFIAQKKQMCLFC